MRETFFELFDYDLWANLEWVQVVDQLPDSARASKILSHILMAQHSWYSRCTNDEEIPPPSEDFAAEFQRLNAAWKDLIRICDPSAYASYTNQSGEPFFTMIEDIARHVINHGTYHRGHLRGLCEAAGFEGFPETDLIRWVRQNKS